jgi:hypothetical protein
MVEKAGLGEKAAEVRSCGVSPQGRRGTEKKSWITKDTKVARRFLPRILRVSLVSFVVAFDLLRHGRTAALDSFEMQQIPKPVHADEELKRAFLVI